MLATWVKTLYKLLLGFAEFVFESRLASHVHDRVFHLLPVGRLSITLPGVYLEVGSKNLMDECSNRKILTSSDITREMSGSNPQFLEKYKKTNKM